MARRRDGLTAETIDAFGGSSPKSSLFSCEEHLQCLEILPIPAQRRRNGPVTAKDQPLENKRFYSMCGDACRVRVGGQPGELGVNVRRSGYLVQPHLPTLKTCSIAGRIAEVIQNQRQVRVLPRDIERGHPLILA